MKVNVMLSIIPIGVGVSLSSYVAACERVLSEAGVKRELHAHGTNVEGEWDEVFDAVRRCIEKVHAMGAPRVSTFIKLGTRTDLVRSGEDMVRSVERKLRDDEH